MQEVGEGGFPRRPNRDTMSPGLVAGLESLPAYELKFQLTAAEADHLEAWGRHHLTPDPHGLDGSYDTTSVYCDTADWDVFHRSPRYRRSKFRLRRYGTNPIIFLEIKSKWGDRVEKKRTGVARE